MKKYWGLMPTGKLEYLGKFADIADADAASKHDAVWLADEATAKSWIDAIESGLTS